MSMNIEGNLRNQSRESLAEIARMAYGHRVTERTNGGNGNIGIYVDSKTGVKRVIKFNTHREERKVAGNPTDYQFETANNLRAQLLQIARNYGVDAATMGQIREKLGLPAQGDGEQVRSLLERSVVAKVVKMIDGDIWQHALKDVNMENYSSAGVSTTFSASIGSVAIPKGRAIKDIQFLKTLVDSTNDELRLFGEFANTANIHVDPKLGTTIIRAVNKAVQHRMTQPPGTDREAHCRNLAKNIIVLSLLAWGRDAEALTYINHQVNPPDEPYENLAESPFASSATAMHAMRASVSQLPSSIRQAAINRAVEDLSADRDGVVTHHFGNTVGPFASSVAVVAATEARLTFRGKGLSDRKKEVLNNYSVREKAQPVPPPVSTDQQTIDDVKSGKGVFGKGPKTVAFTPEHVTNAKNRIEEAMNEVINDPNRFDNGLKLIARDMNGQYQMIYDDKISYHPSLDKDPPEKDEIKEDLTKVFTREDGTVDEEAMKAFVAIGSQVICPLLYSDYPASNPGESEFPVRIPQPNTENAVVDSTIRLDRGCEPGTYRVTFRTFSKGGISQAQNFSEGGQLVRFDPNDQENFIRYDCTFDFKVVDGHCVVTFPEIPTVSMNLNAPVE